MDIYLTSKRTSRITVQESGHLKLRQILWEGDVRLCKNNPHFGLDANTYTRTGRKFLYTNYSNDSEATNRTNIVDTI